MSQQTLIERNRRTHTVGDSRSKQTASFREAGINLGVRMTASSAVAFPYSCPSSRFTSPVHRRCSSTWGQGHPLNTLCWSLRVANDAADLNSSVSRSGVNGGPSEMVMNFGLVIESLRDKTGSASSRASFVLFFI